MTNKPDITELLSAMDMLLLEQKEDRSFNLAGDIPKWFLDFDALDSTRNKQFYPERLFNFLEGFIEKNQPFWNAEPDKFEKKISGWWTEIDKNLEVHYLQATAANYKKKKYLIIEHATNTSEIFRYLQKYKETMVEFETSIEKENPADDNINILPDLLLTDHVTGLHNKKAFFLLAEHQQGMAKRNKYSILVCVLNINDIHLIKKKYGDTEVNAVLSATANILKQTFRSTDVIGKLRQNEFGILSLEIVAGAEKIIFSRLKKNLEMHNKKSFKTYKINFNIGYIKYDSNYSGTFQEAITVAGFRLNENKKTGKVF